MYTTPVTFALPLHVFYVFLAKRKLVVVIKVFLSMPIALLVQHVVTPSVKHLLYRRTYSHICKLLHIYIAAKLPFSVTLVDCILFFLYGTFACNRLGDFF